MPRWPVAGDGQSHREICGEGGDEDGATAEKEKPLSYVGRKTKAVKATKAGFQLNKEYL